MTTVSTKSNFLLYYQCALAIGAISIFFTDLHLYLYNAEVISFSPVLFIALFGVSTVPLLASNLKYLPIPLMSWCGLYVAISSISFLLSTPNEVVSKELQTRLFSTLFLIIMIIIFGRFYLVQLWTRWAVFVVTILNILNNILELLNPLVFSELNDTGRPAGFYVDPNKSGCALVLGMIFSVSLLPAKYRIPFILLVGFGIALTFSRGAILSWLIVVMILLTKRVIPRNQLFYWVVGLGVGIIIIQLLQANFLSMTNLGNSDELNPNIAGRLNWLQNPSSSDANSDTSRLEIIKYAWQKFSEKPFFGNGIAYTQLWGEIRAHNMYLLFMVEHGFLGIFLLPLLIYCVIYNACGETKNIAFSLAIFLTIWGCFSHRIVEERYILIMISLMAAMTIQSQFKKLPSKA